MSDTVQQNTVPYSVQVSSEDVPTLESKGGGSTQKVGHWIGLESRSRLAIIWSWQMESSEAVSGHVHLREATEQSPGRRPQREKW